MSTSRILVSALASLAAFTSASAEGPGLGKTLKDVDIPFHARYILPDGSGLPPGRGTAATGKSIWEKQCGYCHGITGIEGPIMPPVGPTETYPKPAGQFWPYATTLFDYIRRAMPFPTPKSLSDDEVYAVTAYILYRNGLIDEDAVIDANSLPRISMPGRKLETIDVWAEQGDRPYLVPPQEDK